MQETRLEEEWGKDRMRDKGENENVLTSQNLTGWGHLTSGLNHLEPAK